MNSQLVQIKIGVTCLHTIIHGEPKHMYMILPYPFWGKIVCPNCKYFILFEYFRHKINGLEIYDCKHCPCKNANHPLEPIIRTI